MSKDSFIDVLLTEYSTMREELRMTLSSMVTNLRTMILLIGGIVTIAVTLRDERILFLIPTVIFLLGIGQMILATSANVLGVYCQVIEHKLRDTCGSENVVMNWEGGALWRNVAHPVGVVQIGFFFISVVVISIFGFLTYRAYLFWKLSLAIHILEAFLLIVYAILSMKWNLISTRQRWTQQMLNRTSNIVSEASSGVVPNTPPSSAP